jgi:flagellar biosynthesis/type III secretory pathway M-ring protein FliF/YscJ
MNWTVIILVGIAVLALIVFLVVRNLKDEKVFEDQLNNDYHKSKEEEGDAEIDEVLK